MGTELNVVEPQPMVEVDNSPPALIRLALENGSDVAAVKELVALLSIIRSMMKMLSQP